MGQQGEANMAEILVNIQAQLTTLTERMTRMEQPQPARRGPIRGVNLQRENQEEDDDMPNLEDDPPPDPNLNQRPRRQQNRDRGREEETRHGGKDIKLTAPTFAGKVNPEAYLEWERRMESIFDYYEYNDQRRVSLASAQFTEHALAWWDREVSERRRRLYPQISEWRDMKVLLRKRYVPSYYHRDLQKKFRRLSQGSKTVEEYFEEFETLKNRLEIEDSEETLMAQFLDGLHDRIARKVERQAYQDLEELLHLATQAEQHIKRKTASTARSKSNWNQQPQ